MWNRATKIKKKVCGGLRCMKKQKMAMSLVSVQIMRAELLHKKSIKGSVKDVKQFEALVYYSSSTQKPQFYYERCV